MKRAVAIILLLSVAFLAFSQDSATDAQGEVDPLLYAIGAVGVANLYFSYSFLGSVADGVAAGIYDPVTAEELADDAISLNTSSRDVLTNLLETQNLADADREALGQMIEAHDLLIQEAWGLLSFIADSSDSEDFRRYRDEAWNVISELVGPGAASAEE